MLTKEELNNKYIKYILEINEEIFNKIIDKLENLGFVQDGGSSRKQEYLFFKNGYPFLRTTNKYWRITKLNQECEEIQVSDVLDENWSNFEVDEWYKLDNWISKFKRLEAGYKFWGENINTKTGFIDDEGWLNLKSYKPIKISIEEVQQYLPEGHADKIKKWSVGSYIVPLQNRLLTRTEPLTKGKPYEIIENSCVPYILDDTYRRINFVNKYNPEEKEGIRWFPTLKEAEAFSKELLEADIKELSETEEDNICETCNGEGVGMVGKLYPSGHTEVMEDCPDCNGLGYIESEIDGTFKEGILIKGEFYNLPGYAIFEAGKKGYIGSGGRDWRPTCDNNWEGSKKDFVPATPLEKKWVVTCRKQNKFIKQSDLNKYDDKGNLIEMKQCVITTTQEEWDFCLSKCDQSSRISKCNDKFKQWSEPYPEGIAVYIENNSYCGVNWFKNNGYEVIPFQEFLDSNGYTFEEGNMKKRYVKYDETFTEDMFNYMLDWAEKQNFPGKPYTYISNTFDSFKIKGYFWFNCHNNYCYGVDNNPQNCTEITFKELFPEYGIYWKRLSDLKNPVFNIGDKVRVIADSLKEFNNSWCLGNNTDYKKGYEGLITGIDKTKSNYEEVNTWYYLDGSSEAMSCNLLELVEPVKKEFDRNWYVEVNNQEEADLVFNWLKAQGEPVINKNGYLNFRVGIDKYINYWKEENTWLVNSHPEKNTYQKQLSDVIPNYSSESKIDRNVYYKVNNQEEYYEIMSWLKTIGEPVTTNYFHVTDGWYYIIFNGGRWVLSDTPGSRVKEEYYFKNNKQLTINISPPVQVIHYDSIVNEKHEVKIINVPKI